MKTKKLAIGVSGSGSTFEAIVVAAQEGTLDLGVSFVFADRDCKALARANKLGIDTVVRGEDESMDDFHVRVTALLDEQKIDIVALAGYLRFFPVSEEDSYIVVNSHPAAIPYFGGKGMYGIHVHEAVHRWLDDTDWVHPYTYATVHMVTKAIDDGAILGIKRLRITKDMGPVDIAEYLLPSEHENYIQVLKEITVGRQVQKHYPVAFERLIIS